MASEAVPAASKSALTDWNRRIRRLARDYAPKYRPLVLILGYHTNLSEGRTYVNVQTIAQESARYRDGKPLCARQVKRILAEMTEMGVLKSEERFRESGRQTSSYRVLVTSLAIDRPGFTKRHDFWAPLPEENVTPDVTPDVTPELAFDLPKELPHHHVPGEARSMMTRTDDDEASKPLREKTPDSDGAEKLIIEIQDLGISADARGLRSAIQMAGPKRARKWWKENRVSNNVWGASNPAGYVVRSIQNLARGTSPVFITERDRDQAVLWEAKIIKYRDDTDPDRKQRNRLYLLGKYEEFRHFVRPELLEFVKTGEVPQ